MRITTSYSQYRSDMEVQSPTEENLSASAFSSSQVQQLIRTNEALLKTNESLKELVISVVELLRDPTRHATYGEPLRTSDSTTDAQHQMTSSLSLSKVPRPTSPPASLRDTSRKLSPDWFARGNAYGGISGTLLRENICPMTFEEIDAETAMYRQKYEEIWKDAQGGAGKSDPWREHSGRARDVLSRHFLYDTQAGTALRTWKSCSGMPIEPATLVGYGEGKVQLRTISGEVIMAALEDLSDFDVDSVVGVTGLSLREIELAPPNSSEGILRSPIILDDLFQALYYGYCRSARGGVTRSHAETLLSPMVLKVLIRIRFTKAERPQTLSHILRGVVIIGRCLQTFYFSPDDGSPKRPWTLRNLLLACYRRRLFHLPEPLSKDGRVQDINAGFEAKVNEQIKWLYWVVCATNLWDKFDDLTSPEASEWAAKNVDLPLQDLFKHCSDNTNRSNVCDRAEGPSFPSRDINIQTLKELGRLQLQWTDNHADHLKLSSTSEGKRLSIFWNRTSCDVNNLAYYQQHGRETEELSRTYALIFGPLSSSARRDGKKIAESDSSTKKSLSSSMSQGRLSDTAVMSFRQPSGSVEWRDVQLLHEPARAMLETYMELPVPPEEECVFGGYFFYPFAEESKKAPKIGAIVRWGQPSPSSMLLHIEGILGYSYRLEEYEDFNTYPVFENRLRELKAYMDSRRPRGFLALWKDKRDSLQWFTFWAVLIVGSLSIFLAFASLAVSTAQTVASFRQLQATVSSNTPR